MRVRKGMHVRVCICERRLGEKEGKESEHSCAKAVDFCIKPTVADAYEFIYFRL